MSNKKKMIFGILIGGLLGSFVSITYAFFIYSRVGSNNTLQTGNVYFNSTEQNTITLQNVFPINKSNVDTDNLNTASQTINITGNTTYTGGVEYIVKAVNVVNTVGVNKNIPISVKITANNLGTSDNQYFTNRGGNTSLYKIIDTEVLENNAPLLVGYIASGVSGINGSINIKVYIDTDKIIISDTMTNNEVPSGKILLTTTEWNSLNNTGLTFKVNVEARENTWVEPILKTLTITGDFTNVGSYCTGGCVSENVNFEQTTENSADIKIYRPDGKYYVTGVGISTDPETGDSVLVFPNHTSNNDGIPYTFKTPYNLYTSSPYTEQDYNGGSLIPPKDGNNQDIIDYEKIVVNLVRGIDEEMTLEFQYITGSGYMLTTNTDNGNDSFLDVLLIKFLIGEPSPPNEE